MDKKQIVEYLDMISQAFVFTAVIVVVITFYTAYTNDSKSVLVLIDKYHEANIEAFVVFPLILLSGIYNFIKIYC